MMDNSDPLTLRPPSDNTFTKMRERTPLSQMMTCKGSNMLRVVQVMQKVVQKSCRRAFQLFCCPLDAVLNEQIMCCPAQKQLTEDKTMQVTPWSPPSTVLIVNISNSTLINCAIGNDTYSPAKAESQPLLQASAIKLQDQAGCSCRHGQQEAAYTHTSPPAPHLPLPSAEPPNISIHSSQLNFVIIGDNNHMHAEQIYPSEEEEV